MLGLSNSWLIPAAVGVGIGYLLSPMIGRFLPIKPFQAMAATRMPMRRPTVSRPVTHSAPMIHPATAPLHYVPVRRSFDRSYDSWLHTTVNSLPSIG